MATINDVQLATSALEAALTAETAGEAVLVIAVNATEAAIVAETAAYATAQSDYNDARTAAAVLSGEDTALPAFLALQAARQAAEASLRTTLFSYLGVPDPNG